MAVCLLWARKRVKQTSQPKVPRQSSSAAVSASRRRRRAPPARKVRRTLCSFMPDRGFADGPQGRRIRRRDVRRLPACAPAVNRNSGQHLKLDPSGLPQRADFPRPVVVREQSKIACTADLRRCVGTDHIRPTWKFPSRLPSLITPPRVSICLCGSGSLPTRAYASAAGQNMVALTPVAARGLRFRMPSRSSGSGQISLLPVNAHSHVRPRITLVSRVGSAR